METVGFIGLGNMGGGMAANIQRAGHPMVIYDLREETARPLLESGARLANSPSEVAELSDITFTSLPGPRSEEHTSELQSLVNLVCRLLLEKKNKKQKKNKKKYT